MADSGLLTKPMPLEFNGNISEKWKTWKKEFEIYIEAIEYANKPAPTKRAILLNLIGKEGRQIAENFNFQFVPNEEEQTVTMELLMQRFEIYCNPRKNTMYTRYKLWNMNKLDDETIDQFATRLQIVARDGAYGDQEENMIRDRIVFGIKEDSLRERILEKDDIPLQRVLSMVRSHEITREQMKTIKNPDLEMFQIQKTQRSRQIKNYKSRECEYCGLIHERGSCPAYGKICHNCQKINHFASVCRQRKPTVQNERSNRQQVRKKIHDIQKETTDNRSDTSEDEIYITTIQSIGSIGTEWYQDAKLENTNVKFKLDSGAQANVIPSQTYNKLGKKPRIKQTNIKLKVFGGKIIEPEGSIDMRTTIMGHTKVVPYIIANVKSGPVLGLDTCKQFSLIKRNKPDDKRPTEETQHDKRKFTNEQQMLEQYKEVFEGIGCYREEIQLHVKKEVQPTVHPPRKIPISLQDRLKTTIENLVNDDIIEKVEYPTNWVNSLVIKEKKDGKLRLCMDPRDLNKALLREHYRIPTAEEIYTKLRGKKYFTVIDQKCGYWNIKLDSPSADLCTFNTPAGRYRFKRLPFGLSVAPEIFQRKNDKEFGDLPGIGISTDDFIIGGNTKEECIENVRKVLQRAKMNNTRFNKDKIQFCKQQVKYLGHLISADGIAMDPDKVQAIIDIQAPTTKTEVRSLLGLVTYLMPFIPDLPNLTVSLREIIKQKNEFYWTDHHDKCLANLKKAIINATNLKHFDPNKQTTIQADASQYGLGACLMQDGNPIAYTSRALQDHETRYAQIEKEFLAITNACEKFHYYIYGYKTLIQTDHKPLVAIMEKPLDKITNRLQRFVLRLQKYNIKLIYKPGKELVIADLLSRNFNNEKRQQKTPEMETIHNIETIRPTQSQLSGHWKKTIADEMERDEEAQALKKACEDGWPQTRKQMPTQIRAYWTIKDKLKSSNGLILLGNKIFVPMNVRAQILKTLHEAHQGIEKTKSRARQIIFWPGLTRDIETLVTRCMICQQFRNKNPREPLMPHPIPERPWQKLAMDIFEIGKTTYLLIVDYYSKYPEIAQLTNKTAEETAQKCREIFSRHGSPQEIICDNMPFNSTIFRRFCHHWDIKLTNSSPRYPQSNGMAERFVQTIKKKLKKATLANTDKELMLLEYRNTPLTGLPFSPAQLLMSRTLRTRLPAVNDLLIPKLCTDVEIKLYERQMSQKQHFNRGTKLLRELQEGESCQILTGQKWQPAKIIRPTTEPRAYHLINEEGNTIRRNRKHIIPTKTPFQLKQRKSISDDDIDKEDDASQTKTNHINNKTSEIDAKLDNTMSKEPQINNTNGNTPYITRSGRAVRKPEKWNDYEM